MAINKSYYRAKDKALGKKDEIKYEVLEECGSLGKRQNDREVKLRYMSWNGRPPKYDLRPWYEDEDGNERCGKGIEGGLTGEELEELYNLIGKLMEE